MADRIEQYECSLTERSFLELAQEFYGRYLIRLRETAKEDFDGLMQRAVESIARDQTTFRYSSGTGDLKQLRYILVDEYQDFSELFHRLVEAIKERNPRVEFFCVGDDWQAIYGWAGADLRFHREFDLLFAPQRQLKITKNYRSAKAIVDLSNALMLGQGTPGRARDDLQPGHALIADLAHFVPSAREEELFKTDRLFPAVLRLVNRAIQADKDVVLLSRTNSVPLYLMKADSTADADRSLDEFLRRLRKHMRKIDRSRVTWSTVHKYKGLEKSVVVIIDGLEQRYPLIHPHWIFIRVFGTTLEDLIDEERRLLYVAMTRAVDWLFIVTEVERRSPFLSPEVTDAAKYLFWASCPPVLHWDNCVTIVASNLPDRPPESGTYPVHHLLSAEDFGWRDVSEVWSKSVPSEGFDPKAYVDHAAWIPSADGVRVAFMDGSDATLAAWEIRNWRATATV